MDITPDDFARMRPVDNEVETCWALVGPSRLPLTCGIYRTDVGLEVRVGYDDRPPLYARRAGAMPAARAAALELRDAVNDRGVFSTMLD